MTKDNRTNLKTHLGKSYKQNDRNLSAKVQNLSLNDINLSLNSRIINMSAKLEKISQYQLESRYKKKDVTGVVTHFFVKQAVATNTNNGYYIDLSKKHASGKPDRYSLAFFMPVIGVDSQSLSKHTDTAPQAHLSATRGQTIISIANHLLTDYDGLTLQNKIAERRICGAVACVTESKTRHPILLPYSVAHTQKTTQGGHHNA